MEPGKIISMLLVILLLSAVAIVLLAIVITAVNEEPRKRCGNCTAFDRDLRICWYDNSPRGEYSKKCVHHNQDTEKRPKKDDTD